MEDQVTTQSHYEYEQEQQIVLLVQALHNQISHKLFTIEVVSSIHDQLFGLNSSNTFSNTVLNRYMISQGEGAEHRLLKELEIFNSIGQVSSYFVCDQDLDAFAADETLEVAKEWLKASQKATSVSSLIKKVWTRENLKDLRSSLRGEGFNFEKRKTDNESSDCTESKRAREFNDLYNATPRRKQRPRAVDGSETNETNTMDLS
ncbi:hypothetical protein N431DRAFT_492713 [Stipitochalara longipes BDJ]|nr:hypothetical protein N431DRAFT_492713 [Stipitochalara longipes BDJ]